MGGRLARDDEVTTWREQGWVLIDGLVPTDVIDAAAADLRETYPTPAEYHADPDGVREKWLGRPPPSRAAYTWPETGPGFRPEQHIWQSHFPFPGSGNLNGLCVHPGVVDFAERALDTTDLRLYQIHNYAKFTGETNYEQPMHTDRNHSWLPAPSGAPWWHLETFLYLSDVNDDCAPTHLVARPDSEGRDVTAPLIMPKGDPEIYAAERPAPGIRGSLLAYRSDVFHRGTNITAPGGARFILGLAFKTAGQDWIGYDSPQSRSTSPDWVAFAEQCTPRELELFGFPPPGHPIWDAALLDATANRYPKLDLDPWRATLES
jgi:hypothetical protein